MFGAPYLDGHKKEVREGKERLHVMGQKFYEARGTVNEIKLKKELYAEKQEFMRKRRKWRAEWLDTMLADIEKADKMGDAYRFYKGLRKLGVCYQDNSKQRVIQHSLEELRSHFMKIGDEASVVAEEVLKRLPKGRPVDRTLGNTPDVKEMMTAMNAMKESAPGKDEVTVNMLKCLGVCGKQILYDVNPRAGFDFLGIDENIRFDVLRVPKFAP